MPGMSCVVLVLTLASGPTCPNVNGIGWMALCILPPFQALRLSLLRMLISWGHLLVLSRVVMILLWRKFVNLKTFGPFFLSWRMLRLLVAFFVLVWASVRWSFCAALSPLLILNLPCPNLTGMSAGVLKKSL